MIDKPYSKDIEMVLNETKSSKSGLDTFDAQNRLKNDGKNLIVGKKKKSEFVKFLGQFKDVLILVLLVSCVISVVIGIIENSVNEFIDAGIILLVVLINAIIGYVQEHNSEKAMQALKNLTKPYCKVVRDGKVVKVKSEEVVIGDIVVLEAGDIAPADVRLIETNSLKIEESALTGESEATEKEADLILDENVVLNDRKNMAYMGSIVTYGRGRGVVTSCGMQTEIGKIASALDEIKDETTPLTKRIKVTSLWITGIVLFVALIIFIVGIATGANIFSSFTLAIAVAVCAIPEGLPACVTITLSMGVKKMSEQRAIVKKLPAVETLGSTEIICTDKTGTLTLNKMTVKKAFFFDNCLKDFNSLNFAVQNVNANTVKLQKKEEKAVKLLESNKTLQTFMIGMVLCNDVQIKLENDNLTCIGDPTEVALVHCGYRFGSNKELLEGKFPRVGEVPFESNRKMMTTVNMVEGNKYVFTKGALDSVLGRCKYVLKDGKKFKLTEKYREEIVKQNSLLASDALRVLALAYKKEEENLKHYTSDNTENDLIFVGLIGMIDPPRAEVAESIKTCNEAGITVVMITGDNKETAFAIGKELGICQDKKEVISGAELDLFSEDDWKNKVGSYHVFARVSPEHKVKIVKAFKANDKIVAMIGDGVNDAPAIKVVDIGVGMGITGTDVTKEAADMILTDDNFSTVVGAVKEGRKIYQNILKIIEFLLGACFTELIAISLITCIFRDHTFFSPVLLLWINFVSDTFVGLALGFEKADDDIMKDRPVKTNGSLFKGKVGFNIFCSSIFVSIVLIALYIILTYVFNLQSEFVTTVCFIYLVFTELFHSYNLKSDTQSLFHRNPFDNKILNYGFLLSALLTIIIVLLPIAPIQSAFGIMMIDWWGWLLAIGLALLIIPYIELVKVIVRHVKRRKMRAYEAKK